MIPIKDFRQIRLDIESGQTVRAMASIESLIPSADRGELDALTALLGQFPSDVPDISSLGQSGLREMGLSAEARGYRST